MQDRFAPPVIKAFTELLLLLVDTALEKSDQATILVKKWSA
jgi:hypothetical protein